MGGDEPRRRLDVNEIINPLPPAKTIKECREPHCKQPGTLPTGYCWRCRNYYANHNRSVLVKAVRQDHDEGISC